MSLQKSAAQAMQYEASGKTEVSNASDVMRKAYKREVAKRSTIYTLWLLAVKHKVALLAIGNIILVLNWALPEWPQMVLGLIGK